MKWTTTAIVHYDRLICPWLILRFIDPDAEFHFIEHGDKPDPETIAFAVPGSELAFQSPDRPASAVLMDKYQLSGPILDRIRAMAVAAVKLVLQDEAPDEGTLEGQLAQASLIVAEGLMITCQDDREAIAAALPMFDGLYGLFQADEVQRRHGSQTVPDGVGTTKWNTGFRTALAMHGRPSGNVFGPGHAPATGPSLDGVWSKIKIAMGLGG